MNGKRGAAGEGGGLPKGLSLFRFIFFSCVMLGSVYGAASLYFNTPPLPGDISPQGVPAAQWSPSPLWLPSYVAYKCQLGVRHINAGYIFVGRLGRATYGSSSIFLGMLILGVTGWISGELIRRAVVRRRNA